jgi:hypothetical protein
MKNVNQSMPRAFKDSVQYFASYRRRVAQRLIRSAYARTAGNREALDIHNVNKAKLTA